MLASGFLYHGTEYPGLAEAGYGALVTKGLTLEPRPGNPAHRLAETEGGLLNSIGLHNPGAEGFVAEVLPDLLAVGPPVIANVSGFSVAEYADLTAALAKLSADSFAAYEVNLSCPNIHGGRLDFGLDPAVVGEVIAACREATGRPLIAKLTPIVHDLRPHAEAALAAGADALTVANTWPGIMVDTKARKAVLGTVAGGLSGPAVLPLTLRHCLEVWRATGAPIMASGGVMTVDDALAYALCGARWIQIGTLLFADPAAAMAFPAALAARLEEEGGLESLIGEVEER